MVRLAAASAPGSDPNTFRLVLNLANSSGLTVPSSSASMAARRSAAAPPSSSRAAPPPAPPRHTSPITARSSSRVTRPSPSRSNIRNTRSASSDAPPANTPPVSVKLPNLRSAAALAAAQLGRASAAPGSSLNPPLYELCAAAPISAAACISDVRT